MVNVSRPANVEEAEDFLSKVLPQETAANPKYRSGDATDLTRWLTKNVRFSVNAETHDIEVAMSEEAAVFRNGSQAETNTHLVAFAIRDVHVLEYEYPADTTEAGEKAVGVMFKCDSGKCIRSIWNGHEANKAEADLYLYDPQHRAEILHAFRLLVDAAHAKT